MNHSKDWTKFWPLVPALGVLLFEYEVVTYKSIDLTMSVFSIKGLAFEKPDVILFAVLVSLVVGLITQIMALFREIRTHFKSRYKENRRVIEYVQREIAEVTGTNAFGAPLNSFNPSLNRRTVYPGTFRKQNGTYSGQIEITLPISIHVRATARSFLATLTTKLALQRLGIVGIGFWAIMCLIS